MNVGPTFPLEEKPVAIFSALFTPQLVDHIVETNRFATLCLTTTHISIYLGFAILIGINRLPDRYDYWSTSELFHYFPTAPRIPRKRFLKLSRFLHFTDNATIPPQGDSHDGYVSDVDIYTGRDNSTETNLGEKVVKKLSRPLIGGRGETCSPEE